MRIEEDAIAANSIINAATVRVWIQSPLRICNSSFSTCY